MNNITAKDKWSILKAISAYANKFPKGEQPHEAYCRIAGDQVILASSNNRLAFYNIVEDKLADQIGGFKK